MTIRHMIIFRTVCETGYNSTKAAEVLHMTQPAVSLAIKELEQYYGVHLFDRIGRRLQITDAGQHFLQYAIHISDLFSDMETGLRDWDSKGVLRIGASITIGSQFLPDYVKAFSELCPGLDVRVTVEQSERLEQKILANELDCALIEGIAHDPNIVSEAYMEDHLSVICSTDKGWTQGQVISIEDFQRQRFLLREKGSGTREVFNRVVEQAGIHITPVWEAMSTTALVNAAINVFLLKVHGNVLFFQLADVFQAIQCITGESADGLSNDHIDLGCHAGLNHAVELFTLLGVGT